MRNPKIVFKNIKDILPERWAEDSVRREIDVLQLDAQDIRKQFKEPTYLDALFVIVVLTGDARLEINRNPYEITTGNVVLLSGAHLFNVVSAGEDFSAQTLLLGKTFMANMDATDMIYKRIKYGAQLYNSPIVRLTPEETGVLLLRINELNLAIEDTGHRYHKELILNRLFAFYLDLSNIIERRQDSRESGLFTRYESIIKSFIELLIEHYTREHKVNFYARQLHITPHYLTLIVKQITGQTVNEFIVEMLYSEARNLLIHSKLSIQEIASVLHFADQSSFGKFFKRHSGVSPIVFRKESCG